MKRLSIVNVASCWELVREVWTRRDEHIRQQARHLAARTSESDRDMPQFMLPNCKRRVAHLDDDPENTVLDKFGQYWKRRIFKAPRRRLTFDVSSGFQAATTSNSPPAPLSRRHTDLTISNLEPEYTVRGHLHWMRVMNLWGWEGK